MSDPLSLQVLKALTASLEEITTANGFRHDMAGRVFRGRMLYSDSDPLPMLAINQPPMMPEDIEPPNGSSVSKTKLDLLVQGFVEDDQQNPTDPAYLLLDDVQKRLVWERQRDEGFNVLGFGASVTMEIGQGVVRSPDGVVSDYAFFWLPITLEFAEVYLA